MYFYQCQEIAQNQGCTHVQAMEDGYDVSG